ncbi:hypothetical protein B5X24_HaOG210982 [Helicoverpa armigera]|nr:hypothetical protein B5X24_HaOG210982 [Helicoverpa armigera]
MMEEEKIGVVCDQPYISGLWALEHICTVCFDPYSVKVSVQCLIYTMKSYIAVLFLAASVLAEPEPSKVVQKRSGLVGHYGVSAPLIGHGVALGHGHFGYAGHLGGGPIGPIAAGYAAGPLVGGPIGGAIVGADVHTTVTKHVGVPVPAPYPVPVDRPYPVAVKVAVPVPVDRPYAVPVPKPYPVTVEKHVAVPVDRPVPVPVPHAVPYPVIKQVGVPVPQPYPVAVPKPVAVPVPAPVAVPIVKSYASAPIIHDFHGHGLAHGHSLHSKYGW